MPACLTADIIASRDHPRRAELQERVEAALRDANQRFGGELLVPLTITLGDEWQGLTRSVAGAARLDFSLRQALHPLAIASGIGAGAVATPLRRRSSQMDGPCFHRSRSAIDAAKQERGAATVFRTDNAPRDTAANALCLLLHAVSGQWTERQFASLVAFLEHGTEAAAAKALGVAQPTLHQSLARARAKTYLAAREALFQFIDTCPADLKSLPGSRADA
jgi:hypothetical protein